MYRNYMIHALILGRCLLTFLSKMRLLFEGNAKTLQLLIPFLRLAYPCFQFYKIVWTVNMKNLNVNRFLHRGCGSGKLIQLNGTFSLYNKNKTYELYYSFQKYFLNHDLLGCSTPSLVTEESTFKKITTA